MKVEGLLKKLKDPSSSYFCGSAVLLNTVALFYAYEVATKENVKLTLKLADEDKDFFALTSKESLTKKEEDKVRLITKHYIQVINYIKDTSVFSQSNLLLNNYKMLIALLSYAVKTIKLSQEDEIIEEAKVLLEEANVLMAGENEFC